MAQVAQHNINGRHLISLPFFNYDSVVFTHIFYDPMGEPSFQP